MGFGFAFPNERGAGAPTAKAPPAPWDEWAFHFAPQVVLMTALKLGIFPALEREPKSAGGVAAAIACSIRGTTMLLDCLAGAGFLEKEGRYYSLNRFSRRYLLPSSEDYTGLLFNHADEVLKLWLTLPEAVRTGKPTVSIFTEREKERLNSGIAEALFQVRKAHAWKLADLCRSALPAGAGTPRILDVAAGSAVWSIPFALNEPRARVVAVDFAPVLEVAKRYALQFGVEGQYEFLGADIRKLHLAGDQYDLCLLGHICHSLGASETELLIEKCFSALRKNGRILIMDYIPDEERKSELLPLLLALNALLATEAGDTFTFSDYRRWLEKAGFSEIQTLSVGNHSPIVAGVKAS